MPDACIVRVGGDLLGGWGCQVSWGCGLVGWTVEAPLDGLATMIWLE